MMYPTTEQIILSVSEITEAIRLQLESAFTSIWVQGEVSNATLHSSGHYYFTLKDDKAQIMCVCFRPDFARLNIKPLKAGDKIAVQGDLTVYAPRGYYQIRVKKIQLVGLGEALLKLEQLKKKLEKKGFFAKEKKRPLPKFPKTIGVISSPTGAVIQDIINILTRRAVGFHLILYPVRVQGETAASEVAEAIRDLNEYKLCDVIIVARGGGSFEDLMPFNSEVVAESIFNSTIPIISGVGHETDTTICDFVADVRAPTPSAAAEIISEESQVLLSNLVKVQNQILQKVKSLIKTQRDFLIKITKSTKFISSSSLLGFYMQNLDTISLSIDSQMHKVVKKNKDLFSQVCRQLEASRPRTKIQTLRSQLLQFEKAITFRMQRMLKENKTKVQNETFRLDAEMKYILTRKKDTFIQRQFSTRTPQSISYMLSLKKKALDHYRDVFTTLSPKNLLKKGYSIICSQKDGSIVSSIHDIAVADEVKMILYDGNAISKITQIKEDERG